jgi:hypothetical protein
MLQNAPIKPREGDFARRWISDDYFDLIVWYEPDERLHGFQLCYDKEGDERAVTWIRGRPIQHNRIDTGDDLPTENRAPVLVAGGTFPADLVRTEFAQRSACLSPFLRRLVLTKLAQFASRSPRATSSPG